MSVKRRRAKAARNAAAFPTASVNLDSDWVTSGRIACSYGTHDGNPCRRCGAHYPFTPLGVTRSVSLSPPDPTEGEENAH